MSDSQKFILVLGALFSMSSLLLSSHVYADVGTSATSTPSTTLADIATSTASTSATTTTPELASSTQEMLVVATSTAPTPTPTTTPTTGMIQVIVRDGTTLAYMGTTTLPLSTSTSMVLPTNSQTPEPVADDSALGVLLHLEQSHPTFTISDLAYYPSFGEFLINCVTIPSTLAAPDCYNWQYEVNGTYPFLGIDQYQLHDGDSLNLYFGSPRKVSIATSTVTAGESFVTTAESYDPATDTYAPLSGYTIGVTQPNPSDPYSPIQIATSTVDANGTASFTLATPGTYELGIQEDYYSNLTTLTVASSTVVATSVSTTTATTTTATPPTPAPTHSSGGGSGGGSGTVNTSTTPAASLAAAFSYLASAQNADGSFTSPVTDWAAIALSLPDAPSAARSKMATYLASTPAALTYPTDYERHAMALMALGINPYTGTATDVITPIVNSFDGTKIGDASINNDIFALIVLPHAGYSASDTLIKKVVAYTVSQQAGNGSWDFGSTDMTGAALQALAPLSSLPGVSASIARAETFLRTHQQPDAGFGNVSSTSWVLGGSGAAGLSPSAWTLGSSTPLTALISHQQPDGSITTAGEIPAWSTAYALTALENRSWSSLMSTFAVPALPGGGVATTTATTTALVAPVATTTLPIVPMIATSSAPTLNTTSASTTNSTSSTPRVLRNHKPLHPKPVARKVTITESDPASNLAGVAASPTAHTFSGFIGTILHSVISFISHLF
jgi:hypothetical protein